MLLSPHEQERLLLHLAARLAQERLLLHLAARLAQERRERGLQLNYPVEATFPDGTKLVTVHRPTQRCRSTARPPTVTGWRCRPARRSGSNRD